MRVSSADVTTSAGTLTVSECDLIRRKRLAPGNLNHHLHRFRCVGTDTDRIPTTVRQIQKPTVGVRPFPPVSGSKELSAFHPERFEACSNASLPKPGAATIRSPPLPFQSAFDPLRIYANSGDVPAMGMMPFPALLLWLTGCTEQVEETYQTYEDAELAHAITRGWVPAFVPSSAYEIADSHNLDTNRQTLRFKLPPSDVGKMVAGLRSVSSRDQSAAGELFRKHRLGAASEGYVICSEPLNGALAVDRQSGRIVYDTIISWTDDDCSLGR